MARRTSRPGGVTLTTLFSFGENYINTDGIGPAATLEQGKDGILYGTTGSGGTNDVESGGNVLQITMHQRQQTEACQED